MAEKNLEFDVASKAGERLGEEIIFSRKNAGPGFGNKEATKSEWMKRMQEDATFRASQIKELGEDEIRRLVLGKE